MSGRELRLQHPKAGEASEWAARELTYRKGQSVAAVDGRHVENLAGLALEGQVEAELRQERLQRSTQHALSVHADPVSKCACWCAHG